MDGAEPLHEKNPNSSREANQFASPAALRHELRTPLNQIIGYSEMLLEDARDAGRANLSAKVEQIHASSYEIVRRIQELLPSSAQPGPEMMKHVRAGLWEPAESLYQSAQHLAADPDPLLHPFAEHISTAAGELRRFLAGESMNEASSAPQSFPESRASQPGARLLVADDSERNREMLCHQLERQGYAATAVGDGREALRLLRTRPFDLVLLDVLMPELDGFATLESIKADPQIREIPVIMISASDEYASVIRCIEGGAEDYLPKPFDPVLLRARLKASLDKKSLRDEQKRKTEELERAYIDLQKMQDQLVTQEKLASLGSLAAGIAHEIKNPLNFVTNFASLSSDLIGELKQVIATESEEAQELLRDLASNVQKIEEHGKRADRIVRGMLGHARKESGGRELADLNALVNECVSLAFHGLRSQIRNSMPQFNPTWTRPSRGSTSSRRILAACSSTSQPMHSMRLRKNAASPAATSTPPSR